MSFFTKTVGKWVIVVNDMEEALMYEFGKRDAFCAGTVEDVIGGWIEEAFPTYRLKDTYVILSYSNNDSAKHALEAARSKTPSDRRGASRAVLHMLGLDWDDEDADKTCAEIDAREKENQESQG